MEVAQEHDLMREEYIEQKTKDAKIIQALHEQVTKLKELAQVRETKHF